MAKEVKEEEKRVRKRLPKGRGRHGANFLYHIKCKREKKVLNKTSNTIVTRGKVNKVGVAGRRVIFFSEERKRHLT